MWWLKYWKGSLLFQAFGDAYYLVDIEDKAGELESPYVMKNDTGSNIKVRLDEAFRVSYSVNDDILFLFSNRIIVTYSA